MRDIITAFLYHAPFRITTHKYHKQYALGTSLFIEVVLIGLFFAVLYAGTDAIMKRLAGSTIWIMRTR